MNHLRAKCAAQVVSTVTCMYHGRTRKSGSAQGFQPKKNVATVTIYVKVVCAATAFAKAASTLVHVLPWFCGEVPAEAMICAKAVFVVMENACEEESASKVLAKFAMYEVEEWRALKSKLLGQECCLVIA